MTLADSLLDLWDRQSAMLRDLAALVDEDVRTATPSEDGWPLDRQLAHVHAVRREWVGTIDPAREAALPESFVDGWTTPIADLAAIRTALDESAAAVRAVLADGLSRPPEPVGRYDSPAIFLGHMVWHEGWHAGLIVLALRRAGREPSETWQERAFWERWRGPDE